MSANDFLLAAAGLQLPYLGETDEERIARELFNDGVRLGTQGNLTRAEELWAQVIQSHGASFPIQVLATFNAALCLYFRLAADGRLSPYSGREEVNRLINECAEQLKAWKEQQR